MEDHILEVLALQKTALLRLSTSSAEERTAKLRKIESYLLQHKEELCDVMYQDFKKPASEVVIAEMLGVKREINHTIKHLKSWMKPKSVSTPLMLLGTKGLVQYEAKGLCLIISPWNYPFNLSICPLVHAIAAGNAVILKPSELSPNTSGFIKKMISSLFDKSEVAVFEGDAAVSSFLLEQKFDHIFFTGSPAIGKVVMAAAAKHLTSVTLELGGKSPAIVGPDVNVEEAAAKIAWGKFLNNGQTCIAPDYLYVHEKNYYSFLQALEATVETFYGANVAKSKDYARIVNRRHFDRIASLLEDAKEKGAQVLFGGITDADDCFISPTVLTNCTPDMNILQEEIFGPILPIMSFKDEFQVTADIRSGDKPLALYVFSTNTEFNQYVLNNTSSGTSVVNDCLIQFGHNELPFGGVNHSGIGKSGGHYGFVEFSNQKSVVIQRTNLLKNFYPPYGVKVRWMIDFVLKWL
ncbi:aldehyde dehydrogenase family protein [Aquirufa novilacunae]|jgi:aldehyde dehydrogenase (NAD+)|uniref:Aldehyde dehydrogenase n=1 Tax=Aquirufa novilacunae TaxID=3139305 RepID=A0ABW8U1L5_9BACT